MKIEYSSQKYLQKEIQMQVSFIQKPNKIIDKIWGTCFQKQHKDWQHVEYLNQQITFRLFGAQKKIIG